MKKSKMAILSILAVVLLTGCGGKDSITCTMSSTQSGMTTKQKIEVKLENDKVDTMKVTMDIAIPDEYKDQKQTMIDTFKQMGTGMDVKETEEGIRVTADESSSFFDSYNIKEGKVSYDEIKEAFESQNYECE